MYTFIHSYKDHEIKLKLGVWGSEELFVDNKRVSHSNKWTFKNTHHFEVDGHPLVLTLEVLSMMNGECEVTIFDQDEVIFSQTKTFEFSTDGEQASYSEEERNWKKEIEFPSDILNLAWLFYFIMIGAAVFNAVVDWPQAQTITSGVIAAATAFGVYKLGVSVIKGLRIKA